MLTHPMIHQSRLPAQWQLPLQLQHLPLPYSSGHRVGEAEVEEMGVGAAEAAEAVEGAAEEEVHLVGNHLPHLQLWPWHQSHLTMEGD